MRFGVFVNREYCTCVVTLGRSSFGAHGQWAVKITELTDLL
jgi:hypothetical protein